MKQPSETNSTNLWKLQKVFYGVCDASKAWYLRVNEEFYKLGEHVLKYGKVFHT